MEYCFQNIKTYSNQGAEIDTFEKYSNSIFGIQIQICSIEKLKDILKQVYAYSLEKIVF